MLAAAQPAAPERSGAGRDGTGRDAPPPQGCQRHVLTAGEAAAPPESRCPFARAWRKAGFCAPPGPTAGLAWERPSPGMGSAKEPRSLQLLGRAATAEEGCQAGAPGCPPAGDCVPDARCTAGGRAMRNCCAAELEAQGPGEKAPAGMAPGALLPDTGMEMQAQNLAAAGSCGAQHGGAGGQAEKAAPEPCLKAPGKDVGSTPAPTKHVAFREPDGGAEPPTCALMHGQEQSHSEGPPPGSMSPTTSPDPPGTTGSKAGALAQGRAEGSPAQGPGAENGQQPRTAKLLCESYSFEVTPPEDAGTQDMGTQVDSRVSLVSVALSPMSPPDGAGAFTFPKREPGSSAPQPVPPKKDAEMQVSMPVETRSVATGPMTPVAKSPQTSYPEVHVKGAVEEAPEPIREVSWDEKGMTWEVYGASMEVEVLGMAIQKHLEKQIEEHGRQLVTPQSTRASSVKGAPRKGEAKRQPSVFRALLQNVRRPRCCSRAGPATE
ncbi:G protein-regulated inducer of neurite outgrowth 1 [Dromaius novaehollandiae]|uniref:G protein-regulated inducer of neurite outgrowth 1 n=1 Tax=Dromaius novaehollandiae TaxID=8790 RepID=UPI00311F17ED